MSSRLQRLVLLACLWTAATGPALAGTEQHDQTLDPRVVLAQLRQRLDAISNYQCTEITKGGKKHLAYDNQGRGRIRETDENGDTTDLIWDGARTIEVHERLKPNGTVVYSASITPGRHLEVGRGNVPRVYLGGLLSDMLARALENGAEISVEPTEEGYRRVVIVHELGSIMAVVVNPQRGYLPVRLRRNEEIEFQEIAPGIWFPSAVWTQYGHEQTAQLKQSGPRLRFTDVRINHPDFDRLVAPDLPDGSTVADEVHGVRYVVDHGRGLTLTNQIPASPHANPATEPSPESTYSLDANQALRRIAPVSPASRPRFMGTSDPDSDPMSEAPLHNTIYIFEWDGASEPKATYTGAGFLNLSEILHYVCGLQIAQYSGPEHLLNLRLAGDWIVRRDASVAECLRDLEPIVYEQTGVNINFKKQRVDAPVVRATGIFQYRALPGSRRENDVQLFAGRSVNEDRTYVGGGSGTLAQLLRHITNRTGQRFVDDTLSSEVGVSWSDCTSSELDPVRQTGQIYRYDLARLLEHVATQTGLRFETERRTIDEWHLSIKP
ncbi:MAG: hypothetical protein JSW27_23685 [Phycisphaerales bacterium]|nr:MAG: hypothetical protein JSW27_23685 [Phycisphaerales bacterium]